MAFVKEVNINDLGKFLEKDLFPELVKETVNAVYAGCLKSKEQLYKETPVDTGYLVGSWRVEKNPTMPEPSVIIGNEAPYAGTVLEHGAPPFTPPIKPIIEWAARKLKKSQDSPEVRRLAWGVRNKIKNKGIPARRMFSKAIDGYVINNIKQELDKVL